MSKTPSLRPNHALLATQHQLINLEWRKLSIENHFPSRETAFFVKALSIFKGEFEFSWSVSQRSQLINIGNGLKPQMVKCQCRRGEDIKSVLLSGRLTPCPAFRAKKTKVTNDCINELDSFFYIMPDYLGNVKHIYTHYFPFHNTFYHFFLNVF